ncbi:MAG: TMEM165/GDT1 family protein [Nitrospirales bacterium]
MALWWVFLTVFLAELGDKTQLATLLFAADTRLSRTGVFLAASGALLLSTLLAVALGDALSRVVPLRLLKMIAGVGFVIIGAWVLWDARG